MGAAWSLAGRLERARSLAKEAERAEVKEFMHAAFPRLEAWFHWFNSTQQGALRGSFRWRGRDRNARRELNPKTLTSGLDDYPRASHPSAKERHLDLRCWMALASRALAEMAQAAGLPESRSAPYAATAARLEDDDELRELHFDSAAGVFADFGNHSEAVKLEWVWPTGRPQPGHQPALLRRTPKNQAPKLQYVPQIGYVTLFPLLMKLLNADAPELPKMLEIIRSEEHLWTPYGLRSLGRSSSMYLQRNTEHDAPYWRGPIWININYLALRALHHYAQSGGSAAPTAREIYTELRSNLMRNIMQQYYATGYLWEQYDDSTGHGKSSHPFTGWTALIVLISAETY
ncbi:hypothetical protein CYMTET_6780 [Cymbomonas tetramitiformis]|uniref:mannosyl-oligosaccharide glucosidase n=1 Tax=Cymbomonas tetramitiformis TaxID=36881 RepID=A0AAE0GWE3_9CHLO|nr:hypothetical protein CYMTET_6780 [Cymbomonas tetramitiformis]